MNYPKSFVTIALGRKNAFGDWLVDDHVDVQAIATACPQIVITPPVDKHQRNYNLTHLQSGFFLLGNFPTIEEARAAAIRLDELFGISKWNAMGAISRMWNRTRIRDRYESLPLEDKQWMAQYGGPRLK